MARNFVSPQPEPTIITVAVPGQRLGWLKRELEKAGIPYEVQRAGDGYELRTLEQAQPTVSKVLDYQAVPGGTGKGNMGAIKAAIFLVAAVTVVYGAAYTSGATDLNMMDLLGMGSGVQRGVGFFIAALFVWWGLHIAYGPAPAGWKPPVPTWQATIAWVGLMALIAFSMYCFYDLGMFGGPGK
jgi:hypothetical protein